MKTNREIYFNLFNENNLYLNDTVIKSVLCKVNSFKNFTELAINFDNNCQNIDQVEKYVEKIRSGKPYQYVLNEAFFLGNSFFVDERVLIPRQETEQLLLETMSKLDDLSFKSDIRVCDLCCGSGNIGITLKKRNPKLFVICSDIDVKALEITKINCDKHNVEILLCNGDLLEPIEKYKPIDAIICNPPYIEDITDIDPQVLNYEPHSALISIPGTSFYERIIRSCLPLLSDKWLLAFEIGTNQKDNLIKIINKYIPNTNFEFKIDIYGKERFLFIWNS